MTSRDRLERAVLDALADGEPSYVVDLAAQIDEHPLTVDQVCDRLAETAEIRSIGCRRYEITAAGRRHLADVTPATNGSDILTGREGRT